MDDFNTEATAAAALGRVSTKVEGYDLDGSPSLVVVRVRHDEQVSTVDLEKFLAAPRIARGSVVLHDHQDFAAYTNRFSTERTTVWADAEQSSITAVLNDHEDVTDGGEAGWRDHRVSLQLRVDDDWALWRKFDGQFMTQVQFAEFVESMLHVIVRPAAADMLEIAQTFQARRNVDFKSGSRLASGDVQLHYEETTEAKAGRMGNMEIPPEMDVALAPYLGTTAGIVTARVRYRIEGGHLKLAYVLARPDLVQRDAFLGVLAQVRDQLETEAVFNGTAPKALR
jgi:uncharacterized protein YfdQ (DUF2303 family)